YRATSLPHIYTLSLHDALPISRKTSLGSARGGCALVWRALRATLEEMFKLDWRVPNFAMMRGTAPAKAMTPQKPVVQETPVKFRDRKSTRLNSSHGSNSYALFC